MTSPAGIPQPNTSRGNDWFITGKPVNERGFPFAGYRGVLTPTLNPTSGDTITVGSVVYRILTTPTQVNDIVRGGAVTATMQNVSSAINADPAGSGSAYFAGTLAHPKAMSEAWDSVAQTLSVGSLEQLAVAEASAQLSWDAATLTPTGPNGSMVGAFCGRFSKLTRARGVVISHVTLIEEIETTAAVITIVDAAGNALPAFDDHQIGAGRRQAVVDMAVGGLSEGDGNFSVSCTNGSLLVAYVVQK